MKRNFLPSMRLFLLLTCLSLHLSTLSAQFSFYQNGIYLGSQRTISVKKGSALLLTVKLKTTNVFNDDIDRVPTENAGMWIDSTTNVDTIIETLEWLDDLEKILTFSDGLGQHQNEIITIVVDTTPQVEMLVLDGALQIGMTEDAVPGTIRWTGDDFEGFLSSDWISLSGGRKFIGGISGTSAIEPLEIDGAIVLGNSAGELPQAGSVRFYGGDFEGWNGIKWVSLTGENAAPLSQSVRLREQPSASSIGTVIVDGAITLSDSKDFIGKPGVIRWTGEDFEGWNGNKWVTFTDNFGTSVTDIDGNVYPTVKIGNQRWMAENLRVRKYRNGDLISTIWGQFNLGAWSRYDNSSANEQIYGKLYNWFAVRDSRGLCPEGWHIPSDIEWTTLSNSLGGNSVAGGKMKETGTIHWNNPNNSATNEVEFTALPGGLRQETGQYNDLGESGYWWSSTVFMSLVAWNREINHASGSLSRENSNEGIGYSVRCLKDE